MSSEEIRGHLKDGQPVTLVLESASILTGMRRSRLLYEAQRAPEKQVDRILLRLLYADVAAAMTSYQVLGEEDPVKTLPISFEEFLRLSDVTGSECETKVYQLNPHWIVKTKEEIEDPKES